MKEQLTKKWIKYVTHLFKDEVKKVTLLNSRKNYNRIGYKKNYKKYIASEKGKKIRKKIYSLRSSRIKKFKVDPSQKKLIQNFYLECPSDCHVDHIIPISKGGAHALENLQWLSKRENLRKGSSLPPNFNLYPQCAVNPEAVNYQKNV